MPEGCGRFQSAAKEPLRRVFRTFRGNPLSELPRPDTEVLLRVTGDIEPLYRVTSAFTLPDGSVAVADGGTHSLRVFDDGGEEIRRVGRDGDGPGEFRDVTAAGLLPPDSVWVYDFLASRLTVFGLDGTARTVRVDADYPLRTVIGVLGREFLMIESPVLGASSTEGLRRDSVRLVLVTAEDGSTRPFGTFNGRETLVRIRASANSVSVSKSEMPFSYGTRHAVTNGRVVTGETERYELIFRGPGGRVRRVLRSSRDGYAVDGSLRHEYARAAAKELGDLDLVARLEENLEKMPLHERGPAFTGLVAGGAPGQPTELWVRLPATPLDSLVTWVRHDDSGEIPESAVLPADFRLSDVTPRLFLGVREDELGVERIVAYRR